MVMAKSDILVKSVPEAAVPEPTLTVIGVSASRAPPFNLAVTVTVVSVRAFAYLLRGQRQGHAGRRRLVVIHGDRDRIRADRSIVAAAHGHARSPPYRPQRPHPGAR